MNQLAMFSGATFDPALDGERLNTQLNRVYDVLRDHEWWTLRELVNVLYADYGIRASEAGVSARLRDLRKPRFGGHTIERRRVSGGLWAYRLVI